MLWGDGVKGAEARDNSEMLWRKDLGFRFKGMYTFVFLKKKKSGLASSSSSSSSWIAGCNMCNGSFSFF